MIGNCDETSLFVLVNNRPDKTKKIKFMEGYWLLNILFLNFLAGKNIKAPTTIKIVLSQVALSKIDKFLWNNKTTKIADIAVIDIIPYTYNDVAIGSKKNLITFWDLCFVFLFKSHLVILSKDASK